MYEGLFKTIWTGIEGAFSKVGKFFTKLFSMVLSKSKAIGITVLCGVIYEVRKLFKKSK